MARFYAQIKGDKGMASRLGHRSMWAHVRGWNVGVEVTCRQNKNGDDYIEVWRTGGSNGATAARRIALVTSEETEFFQSTD